jgi:glycosyltransferase involved in cell wall biosynthesis
MISVIVPVYNGEKTIERCLKSITEQTEKDIEIIVVDDGSTDNSAEIARAFPDGRIVVLTQKNSRQGEARNHGLRKARGEYAAFVDADDTIEPQMLGAMLAEMKRHDADIVQCNLTDIMPDGSKHVQLERFDGVVVPDEKYIERYMAKNARHSFEVCNKLFKIDFIRKNKLRFEDSDRVFSEDLLFNLEAARYLKKICFISKPYYNYYQNENSHMHRPEQSLLRVDKMEYLFEYYAKKYPETKKQAYYLGFLVQLWNIGACGEKNVIREKMRGGFIQKCARSAFLCGSGFKHKIYAIMTILPPTRVSAAKIKYSR